MIALARYFQVTRNNRPLKNTKTQLDLCNQTKCTYLLKGCACIKDGRCVLIKC